MAHILIADIPESFDLSRQAFARDHKLWFASTLADAQTLIKTENLHLILVGLQFAESQAFEVLQFVRDAKGFENLPVIMYSGRRNRVTDYVIATAGRCAKLLGAHEFIDFSRCRNDEQGAQILRLCVEKCITERFLARLSNNAYQEYERGTIDAQQRNTRQAQ